MRRGFLLAVWAGVLWGEPLAAPFHKQYKNGCGAASVAMVMGYWGREVDAGRVYAELGSGAGGGVELAAMKKYLEGAGFQAFTLRGAFGDLENHLGKGRPLIVALRPGERKRLHFAVVTGVEGERVWLNDPTRSKPAAVGRREFEKQWEQGGRWLMVAAPTRIP